MAIGTSGRSPAYRHYKPKNLGVVRLCGKDHYLGVYDSTESWEKYHRLVSDWHRNGRKLIKVDLSQGPQFFGGNCLVELYLEHAKSYYSRESQVTREYGCTLYAIDPLQELFGLTDANQFGPKSLKLYQQHLIKANLSRGVINACSSRVKRMFAWGVEAMREVVPDVKVGVEYEILHCWDKAAKVDLSTQPFT